MFCDHIKVSGAQYKRGYATLTYSEGKGKKRWSYWCSYYGGILILNVGTLHRNVSFILCYSITNLQFLLVLQYELYRVWRIEVLFDTNKKVDADVKNCMCMSHLNSAGQNSKLNLWKCGRVKILGNTEKILILIPELIWRIFAAIHFSYHMSSCLLYEIMEMLNFVNTQVMKQCEGCPDTA